MPGTAAPSPTDAFFDKLSRTGRVPLLAKVSGSVRIDLTDGRRVQKTRLEVRRGHVTVEPSGAEADCTIATHREVFDALVTLEAHPLTAFLRGALVARGSVEMLVLMRRLIAVAGVPELARGRSRLITTATPTPLEADVTRPGTRANRGVPAKKITRKRTAVPA